MQKYYQMCINVSLKKKKCVHKMKKKEEFIRLLSVEKIYSKKYWRIKTPMKEGQFEIINFVMCVCFHIIK